MAQGIDWLGIAGAIGAVSGLSSSIALIMRAMRKAKLKISGGPYAQNWSFQGTTKIWRFINLEVKSNKGRTASRCVAKVSILQHPPNVTFLSKEYALHWADIPFSGRSTSAEPVDIWGASQRLDIAFTMHNINGQSILAIPIALHSAMNFNTAVPQAVLPQGEYIMRITVSCENGRGDTKLIKLTSPQSWQNLEAEEVISKCKLRRIKKRWYIEKSYLPRRKKRR